MKVVGGGEARGVTWIGVERLSSPQPRRLRRVAALGARSFADCRGRPHLLFTVRMMGSFLG